MLHIHNGDSSANTAKESSLPGEHFAWREALIDGPNPGGLEGEEWRNLRAEHLSEAYGIDENQCRQELWAQEQKLARFSDHEEVVLWFEHDLFCQTILIYLLNWFGEQELGKTKLSLVCIGDFPGKQNFRGLGELSSDELASLFPKRRPVTSAELKLAASAWQAYSSSNPTDIEKFLQTDTSPLAFLSPALRAHLKRFPSTRNGLGRIENTALELIQNGSKTFKDLFAKFGSAETIYGLGDAQFWLALRRMSEARQPLLAMGENGEEGQAASGPDAAVRILPNARFEVTDLGREITRGEADFVSLNGIDCWLGGVHLDGQPLWRWDEQSDRMVSK
jgi:hypothetical protein